MPQVVISLKPSWNMKAETTAKNLCILVLKSIGPSHLHDLFSTLTHFKNHSIFKVFIITINQLEYF